MEVGWDRSTSKQDYMKEEEGFSENEVTESEKKKKTTLSFGERDRCLSQGSQ